MHEVQRVEEAARHLRSLEQSSGAMDPTPWKAYETIQGQASIGSAEEFTVGEDDAVYMPSTARLIVALRGATNYLAMKLEGEARMARARGDGFIRLSTREAVAAILETRWE